MEAQERQEQLAWLALSWGAQLGPAGFARVLAAYGSATAALEATAADLVAGEARLKGEQAAVVPNLKADLERFAEEWADLEQRHIRVVFSTQEQYPAIFRQLPHPPPVLCMQGTVLPIDDLALALVGTRTPTHAGYVMARDLGHAAAYEGFTVISGLARGIDTAAHEGALEKDGRTIALPGSGIRDIFPPENAKLAARISRHGAVISELPPHAEATVPNLMARNRLISLMSRAVIVVQCRESGGSLSTAQAAVQQGRTLLAVTWTEELEENVGNRMLLGQGARALTGPGAIPGLCQELRGTRPDPPQAAAHEVKGRQMHLF
jgi:DNA processing protein